MESEQKTVLGIVLIVAAFLSLCTVKCAEDDKITMQRRSEDFKVCLDHGNPPERCK